MRVRRVAAVAGLGLGMMIGTALFEAASAADEPTYFVDGAVATGEGVQTDADHSGCVTYSADRPDVLVCDPNAPRDFKPAPMPYYDENICNAALQWLDKRNEPGVVVEPSSCLIQQTPSITGTGNWMVIFEGSDGEGGSRVAVPYDPTGQDPFSAHP